VTATDTAARLAQLAGHAAADKLATDILLIDVSDRLAITDVFVIASGSNERQVEAIVDAVEEKLRQVGVKPLRREGKRDGRWVLLDYADIVVHIQHTEERVFYALERLWQDCPVLEFDPMAPAPAVEPVSATTPSGAEPTDESQDADERADESQDEPDESDSVAETVQDASAADRR